MTAFETLRKIQWLPRTQNAAKWGSTPPRDPVIAQWLNLGNSESGVSVTKTSALQLSAVHACIKVLSEAIGTAPLMLYRQKKDGKERDIKHPLYTILHDRPNLWMTPFEFKELLVGCICLRGNFYAEIIRNGGGQVEELIPLNPDRVMPFLKDRKKLFMMYTDSGEPIVKMPGEIFHVMGMSLDGVTGLNPIEYHRETIGDAIATRKHGSKLFSNGAMIGGVLKHPAHLSKEAQERLVEQFKKRYEGGDNAGKTLFLEEGMDYLKLGMTSQDAQFLETLKYQISDIARIFRVPPHMIGDLERATFSNIEQQSLEFVQYTILPWARRIEESIKRDLILKSSQYSEFLLDILMRADIKSRYDAYAVARNWGWMTANEIRARENMNPVDNGDIYLQPLNMQPAGEFDIEKARQNEPPTKKDLTKNA